MREVSYILAFAGGLLLLAAAIVWWRVYTEAREAKARAAGIDSHLFHSAAMLTSVAFAVTGVAAIVAVVSWVGR